MMKNFVVIFCTCFLVVLGSKISPNNVRNDYTDVLYNDALVNPMVTSLKDFVAGIRDSRFKYVPDDVALVQTISSLQDTMFQLAIFYASHEEGTQISRFEGGLAIEFESQRCDNVFSSKFPRIKPTTQPWIYYRDSSYYFLRCKSSQNGGRSRRAIPNPESFTVVSDKELSSQKRKKRAAVPVVSRNGPLCGSQQRFLQSEGTLKFPVNSSGNYSNNMECTWTIEVSQKYAVRLNFSWINMEYDKLCEFDSIKFYEGQDEHAPFIDGVCGTGYFVTRSKKQFLTIKFKSDSNVNGRGFSFDWTVVDPIKGHPGFVLTSTIVVDQVGDLNIDEREVLPEEKGDFPFMMNDKFQLKLTNPSTCPLESKDVDCYFETKPYIISKLVATGMNLGYDLPSGAVEILFDHAVQTNLYPDLYNAPKYCVTWDSGVQNTAYGSWSRKGGKLIETDLGRSICRFSIHGIHAVAAAVPPPVLPAAFRFSLSWYCGLVFAIIWVTITFLLVATSQINIPDWLNLNQLLSLIVFCCIVLSGMHLELHQLTCSILSFLLYYFGLAVFVWHLLKAAQFTGVLDKFFRRDRNLYAFYLILGWCVPLFIAGMAAGVKLHIRENNQSCWFAMKGGTIWGYTSPTYFIVFAICYLYYKGLKKTKIRLEVYNYPRLRNRAVRDIVALALFLLTWICGIFCMTHETEFAPQYFFSLFLCLTVVVLCVAAKQQRRSFEKAYDWEDEDEQISKLEEKNLDEGDNDNNELYEKQLMEKYGRKWLHKAAPTALTLALRINGLENSKIQKLYDTYEILADESDKWNNMYAAEPMMYGDEEEKDYAAEEEEDDKGEGEEDEENSEAESDEDDEEEEEGGIDDDDDNDDDDKDDDDSGDEENKKTDQEEDKPMNSEQNEKSSEPEQNTDQAPEPEQNTDQALEPEQSTDQSPEPEQNTDQAPEPEQNTDQAPEPEQNTDLAPESEVNEEKEPEDDERKKNNSSSLGSQIRSDDLI